MENRTFAQQSIIAMVEKKTHARRFQDQDHVEENYTETDPDDGHSYSIHDQSDPDGGYPTDH